MQSSALTLLLTLLATQVYSTDDDTVACAFNKLRSGKGLTSLKISHLLSNSAETQSKYMVKTDKMTLQGPGNKPTSDRVRDKGFKSEYAMGMVGKGYKDAKSFADDMLEKHPGQILNQNITHLGVGHKGEYWTVDLAKSEGNVASRQASC